MPLSRPRYRPINGYALTADLLLRVPVVQAPLGCCDGPRLAATVSRAGGLGCLTVHNSDPATLRRKLRRVRAITSRPILLAFTAEWERDEVLDVALEEGFRHFHMLWWNGPRLCGRVRRAGGTAFWQVGTVTQAHDALDTGAQVLVAQGTEAGGPVRSPRPVYDFVKELRAAFGDAVPIVAGGGLATADDVRAVLAAGANAALLGTRFLLSEEADADPQYKARLVKASEQDLHLDPRMIGEWPCAPRRRLRTQTDIEDPALFAGLGIGRIHSLVPAADLVRSLSP